MAEDGGVERIAYSIQEVALMLGLDHKTIRRQVAAGEIPSFPIGARIRIPRTWVDRVSAAAYEPKSA